MPARAVVTRLEDPMEFVAVPPSQTFVDSGAPTLRKRRLSVRLRIAMAAFFAMGLIVVGNLNGLVNARYGIEQLFSPVIAVAGVIILVASGREGLRLSRPAMLYTLCLVSYMAIGLLRRDPVRVLEPADTLVRGYSVSLLVIAPAAAMTVIAWKAGWWHRLIIACFAIGLLTVSSVYLSVWLQHDIYVYASVDAERFGGAFANPNEAGIACAAVALFGFAAMSETKRKWPILAGIAACFIAIVLTFSRGSLLTFLVVAATSYAVTSWKFNWRAMLGILVLGGVIATVAITDVTWMSWLSGEQQDRLMDVVNLVTTGNLAVSGASDRQFVAHAGFSEWMESPLVGNGLGTQRLLRGIGQGPHNQFLLMLGDSGILPTALYCAVLVMLFIAGRRAERDSVRIFLAGFSVFIVFVSFHNHNILENRLCNFAYGIAFGLCAIQERQRRAALAASRQQADLNRAVLQM